MGAKPGAAARPAPAPAQLRPASRPSADALSDEDKTPPPTRNPFVRAEEDDFNAPHDDVATHSGMPPKDEPKVEISEDLLAEAASSKSSATPARRPAPAAAPARPATGSNSALRPGAVPPRRPAPAPGSSARPAVPEEDAEPGGPNKGEKTQIRTPPPDRPRR
jgi:pilus assembly protein CpaF